jgi:pimeloyl-ACP methyl ester carboxylesterase
MPTFRINQEELHYEIEGQGPALVLIHSLGTSSELWRDAIARWKDRYTVLAMDCRGHGKSTAKGGVALEAIAGDLRALMQSLKLTSADVVGISMGGPIAAWLYAQAPELVGRMVLADTFTHIPDAAPKLAGLEQKLDAMTMADFGQEYAAQTLLPATASERHQALSGWIAGMSTQAYRETVQSIFSQDISGVLADIAVPVLVMVGDQDLRAPVAMAERVAKLIPGAALNIVPAAGHLANMDNPAAFYSAIDEFFAQN